MFRIFAAAAIGVSLVTPWIARADEQRVIDMTQSIVDERGRAVPDLDTRAIEDDAKSDPNCSSCQPLTVGHIIARALFQGAPNEQIPGDQRLARYDLAKRVQDSKAASLRSNEVTLIKRLLGYFPTVVVGQIFPIIAPNDKAPDVTP